MKTVVESEDNHNEYEWHKNAQRVIYTLNIRRYEYVPLSITFISRLMHSNIQNLEVKIYVVKKFKTDKIKNHSNMFRIP